MKAYVYSVETNVIFAVIVISDDAHGAEAHKRIVDAYDENFDVDYFGLTFDAVHGLTDCVGGPDIIEA